MIRLVALDLDGTLLGGTEGRYGIRDEAIAALYAAQRRGVEIGIATGRELEFILDMFERHGVDPAAAGFPSVIVAEERLIYTLEGGEYRPDSAWNDALVKAETGYYPVVSELVARLIDSDLRGIDPTVRRVAEIEQKRGFVEMVFQSREAAIRCGQVLAQALKAVAPNIVPVRNGKGIALRHVRAAKGTVLRHFADAAGIPPEHILAVGDSENDRTMLDGRYGFQAATVSNADENIRKLLEERGCYIAQGAYGAGVAEVIYRVLGEDQDGALREAGTGA